MTLPTAEKGRRAIGGANLRLDLLAMEIAGKSASTRDGYVRDIHRVAETMQQLSGRAPSVRDILDLDTAAINDIVSAWHSAGVAVSTIRRRLVSLRAYARRQAEELGTGGAIFVADFPRPALPNPSLSPAPDLADLDLAVSMSKEWTLCRDLAITAVAAHQGLSAGELAALDQSSIAGGYLVVQRERTGIRLVKLEVKAADALARYLQLVPFSIHPTMPLWLNTMGGRMSPRMMQLALRRVRLSLGWPTGTVAGLFRRHRILALAAEGLPVSDIAMLMGIGVETIAHHLRD